MKPPEDVSASELWLKLCEPLPSEVIDFPRKDRDGKPVGKIRIQVLTMEDHNKARLLATKSLKESAKEFGIGQPDMENEATKEVLGDMIAHELLCLACVTENSQTHLETDGQPVYARIFASPAQIRKALTADETLVLFNAYRLVQYKYGPFERTMEDGDVDAWIERLRSGGSAFPLLALPLPQLAELTYSLAEKMSMLSRTLGSQWSSLPDTLKSSLENYCSDTLLFGEQLDESIPIFSGISVVNADLATAVRLAEREKDERESGY
jgi:hypothetical protein